MNLRLALVAASCLTLATRFAHAERNSGTRLSEGGMVLAGPRLAAAPDGAALAWPAALAWIEEPKTLVVLRLDRSGAVLARDSVELPELDASVVELWPLVHDDGTVSVALLERDVRRLGAALPMRRLVVRHLAGAGNVVDVIAEAPDDGSGAAPAAIVAFGHYTTARLPTVVWRHTALEGSASERRAPPVTFSILRADGVTASDVLGETRIATAVSWRDDGGALVAAIDAGRPLVVEPTGESIVEVPTPAILAAVVSPAGDRAAWLAAGIDGGRRLFTVAAAANRLPTRSFILPVAPLVDAPADLADSGTIVGMPSLIVRDAGVALVWASRLPERDEVRMRALADDGMPSGGSRAILACPAGERILASDSTGLPGGAVMVAATCVAHGRAHVRAAAVR